MSDFKGELKSLMFSPFTQFNSKFSQRKLTLFHKTTAQKVKTC